MSADDVINALKEKQSKPIELSTEQIGKGEDLSKKTDAEIEKRMLDIEDGKGGDMVEFNRLEKEMEKRERATVFDVTLDEVNNAVDALLKKEKEQPNGYGSFIERRDARETKEVANKYLNAKEISDADLKNDFKEALMGNPATWYADGLKLRESMKEAANRGIDINDMLREVEKEFTKDGFSIEEAKMVIARYLEPIFAKEKQSQPTPQTGKGEDWSRDVESTAKALDKIKGAVEDIQVKLGILNPTAKGLSEAYHKAKADGSNPELVKAVEDLLGKPKETKIPNEPITEPVTKPIPEATPTTKEQGVKEAVPEGTSQTGRTEPEGTAAVLENDGNKVGVSHESLIDLAKRLNLKEPERGEYQSHNGMQIGEEYYWMKAQILMKLIIKMLHCMIG